MAIQQLITIEVLLQGDGVSTTFTFNPNNLFGTTFGDSETLNNRNVIPVGAQFQTVPGTWPAGQSATVDAYGNITLTFTSAPPLGSGYVILQLIYNSGSTLGSTVTWTSATAGNTALTLALQGASALLVPIVISGTITVGVVGFQVSADNVNWFGIQGTAPSGFQPLGGYNLSSPTTVALFNVTGYSYFRVLLNTPITGTGNAAISVMSSTATPTNLITAGLAASYNSSAPAPGSGAVSPVQIDGFGNVFVNNIRRSQIVTATGNIASVAAANIIAGQGVGIFADLAGLILTSRLGATAPVLFGVNISDGTKTYRFNMSSESTATGGGNPPLSLSFDPPLVATTANTAWTIALTSATDTPSVDYVCTFIQQKAS